MASSFRSAQAATLLEFHVPLTNSFVRRCFCAVHDPKPPLHRHNWLSFGKFQDPERFLIHCERHFSSRLPPSGGTCKCAKAPSTEFLYLLICSFLPFLSWLLRNRVRKSRKELWITLYIIVNTTQWDDLYEIGKIWKRLWLSSSTILVFAWRSWGKPWRILGFRALGILLKFWTRHLQNTSLEHHTTKTLFVYNMNIYGVWTKNKIWWS